ncbi:hypothetical protein ACSNNV_16935, partial [Faecalibacterium prausnitzii]|uniref:hypothetical protein n=1 Tax=Faecalibacterium prausnitzii TaxID=853 RepID=UPI003F1A773D
MVVFQLLPIGASKKVRQTVQASLRSAAAEEDGDEDEHSHIMKFGKPYTYKGEKYTEVDLSGVANLTGMNVRQAENRMEEEDIRAAEKTLKVAAFPHLHARLDNQNQAHGKPL